MPTAAAVTRCECQKRRIAAERIREVLEGWPEYADAKLDTMVPNSVAQENALVRIREHTLGSYYLHGYYSRGKTHLLIAQYQALALVGVPCLLRSSRQLADELRRAEMEPKPGEDRFESPVLEMLGSSRHCHLFLDDIEKTPVRTDFRAEAVFHWLDTLKRHQHGLTITGNLQLAELTKYVGDAAVARIDRICTQIEL